MMVAKTLSPLQANCRTVSSSAKVFQLLEGLGGVLWWVLFVVSRALCWDVLCRRKSLTCLVALAYVGVTTPMFGFSQQRNSCCPFPSWRQRASKTGLRLDLQPLSSLYAFLFRRGISKEIKEPWGLENFVLKYSMMRGQRCSHWSCICCCSSGCKSGVVSNHCLNVSYCN